MDENTRNELEEDILLVQYRIKMLDIIEQKLIQMKQIAERIINDNVSDKEMVILNLMH